MTLQEIQTEIDRLKAEETALYDRIDEVQARLIDLQAAKWDKGFWIRKNAPSLEYQSKIQEGLTPEQAYNAVYNIQ